MTEQAETARIIQFPVKRQADGSVWEPHVDEATLARHFSAGTRTVRRWRQEGMPSALIGGSRRYRISEAEAWHSQRHNPKEAS